MNAVGKRGGGEGGSRGLVRGVASVAWWAGAVGSVGFTLYTGRHNRSWVLMGLFVVWVLVPYAAVAVLMASRKRWPLVKRTWLDGVTILVALVSLATYGWVALGPPRAQAAGPFLVVPLALFVLIGLAAAGGALVETIRLRQSERSPTS